MEDCLFCKIIKNHIPAKKVYESDNVIGFEDIQPQAPRHYLFIHKEHDKNIGEMMEKKPEHLNEIFKAIMIYLHDEGIDGDGFRIVTNQGHHGGQTVFHTHFHVLAGAPLGSFGVSRD